VPNVQLARPLAGVEAAYALIIRRIHALGLTNLHAANHSYDMKSETAKGTNHRKGIHSLLQGFSQGLMALSLLQGTALWGLGTCSNKNPSVDPIHSDSLGSCWPEGGSSHTLLVQVFPEASLRQGTSSRKTWVSGRIAEEGAGSSQGPPSVTVMVWTVRPHPTFIC
jgi:hypothetical protein